MVDRVRTHRFGVSLLACIVIVVAILTVFWSLGSHEFVNYDDPMYVTMNPHLRGGFTWESTRWALTTLHTGNWHPLTWLSHLLDYTWYGLTPRGHHLTNLVLHLTNAVLLFSVLLWTTGAIGRSLVVAVLFGVHPLHVESVAWVAERKDVLSTTFWMLTMLAYVKYAERPRGISYAFVVVALILGLLAKPMLVTLPFLLLLLDYWPLRRLSPSWGQRRSPEGVPSPSSSDSPATNGRAGRYPVSSFRSLIWEKVPLIGLVIASSAMTFVAQQADGSVASLERFSLGTRVANAIVSYVTYMGKMIWPQGLAVFYPHPGEALPLWQPVAGSIVLLSLTAVVVGMGRRYPHLPVGWFWYLGTLIPVIGLVQVGQQAMADRYTYVPLIGLFVVIVWGVSDLIPHQRWRRGVLALGASAVIVFFVQEARNQLHYWRDSSTLFQHALLVTSRNHIAHYGLATELVKHGRREEAMAHYTAAVAFKPYWAQPYSNLGDLLAEEGKIGEAMDHYATALRFDPEDAPTHYNLGVLLARQGLIEKAMAHYQIAIRLDPGFTKAHKNLGILLAQQGHMDEAMAHLAAGVQHEP